MTAALTTATIGDAVRHMRSRVDTVRDELNAADRVLGDGDTGMTIASVVDAWHEALSKDYDDVGAMLLELGRETRRATGSSLGSVLAIGLIAAGKDATTRSALDRAAIVSMLGAAAEAIGGRSGAAAGDKTILDSLLAVRSAIARDERPIVDAALDGATQALGEFRSRPARIGRARIYGDKSIGHDDPGMLAALLLLRAAARIPSNSPEGQR